MLSIVIGKQLLLISLGVPRYSALVSECTSLIGIQSFIFSSVVAAYFGLNYAMTDRQVPPQNGPKEKGKLKADQQANSAPTSALCYSAATLLSSFATPSAVTGSLSSATASANEQKVSQSTSRVYLPYAGDLPGTISSSCSTSRAPVKQALEADSNDSTAGSANSSEAQRQFEEFIGSTMSQPTANTYPELLDESSVLPSGYRHTDNGDAVIVFLSSSHSTEAIHSPIPCTNHAPAPTHSQLVHERILTDISMVDDPVEYLLTTTNYTEDIWGNDWTELQRAQQELNAGNKRDAGRRVDEIIGRLKARL
ncbi:hypothetical protein V1517DRAFT_320518 [Lipomyces orientalis]|uniref:Uncharacterized protein n=1 Tax=Lipomyces orientalis TaxID=1233043 RepID=A0ACC3TQ84_9ASCO